MWFIGSTPLLGHDSPVDTIRSDRFEEAEAAATSMAEDGFLG